MKKLREITLDREGDKVKTERESQKHPEERVTGRKEKECHIG